MSLCTEGGGWLRWNSSELGGFFGHQVVVPGHVDCRRSSSNGKTGPPRDRVTG